MNMYSNDSHYLKTHTNREELSLSDLKNSCFEKF